jgi:aspartyl protease family protein
LNGDDALSAVYLGGVLLLVVSALVVRRIPMAQGLKMAGAWVLIFAAAFVLFALKDDFKALGTRLMHEVRGQDEPVAAGREMRIHKAFDGHFWVNAEINGQRARFLIDSGATVTSLSRATAEKAGVVAGGFPAIVETANGIIRVQRGEADRLRVGTIERRKLAVHVSDAFGTTNVLGMNFLSSLAGWGVEGEWLVLKP